ncbi:MAG: prolyl oligopeptidase family serine peptidase [Ilumatobacteraceae bacterium]
MVAQRRSDPRRLVAFGSSFGGYAALMLATHGRLAAAGAHAAPTDLVRFLNDIPREHPTMRRLWTGRFGDPDDATDAARLRTTSPLWLAERIRCRLLLAHGANDTRVPRWHSDALASRLGALGREVAHLTLDHEGHEIQHVRSAVALADTFAALLTPLR